MTGGPARERPLQLAPRASRPRPTTVAAKFGQRMYELADLLALPSDDCQRFAELMHEIARDFAAGHVGEAQFYDRCHEATGLLPMTKKSAQHFAEKIHGHLKETMSPKEPSE